CPVVSGLSYVCTSSPRPAGGGDQMLGEAGRGRANEGWNEGAAHADSPRGDARRKASAAELVRDLTAVAEQLAALDPADITGDAAAELAVAMHRANDRIRACHIGLLGQVDAHQAWAGSGARNVRAWIVRSHDVSFAEASRLLRPARVWRDALPVTGSAAREGTVSTAKGDLIAAIATTPDRIAALQSPVPGSEAPGSDTHGSDAPSSHEQPTGEELLLGLATGYTVPAFARITRRFAHVTDPEADERGYREALAREHFD